MILFKTYLNNFKRQMGLHETFFAMQILWGEGLKPFLFETFSNGFFARFKPVGFWGDFKFVACHQIGACHES